MGSPPSDDSKMLFKLLADMQWHNYYEIKSQIADKVPPGRAVRKYEDDINSRRRMRGDPTYDTTHDEATRIELGARRCAQTAISSWSGRGVIIRGKGPEKEIRVKPGFSAWGIPGFEPGGEGGAVSDSQETGQTPAAAQDPPFEAQGGTEVPPEASNGSESEQQTPQEASGSKEAPVEATEWGAVPNSKDTEALRVLARGPDGKWTSVDREALDTPMPAVRAVFPSEPAGNSASSFDWPRSVAPACGECGLAVSDAETHANWHVRIERFLSGSDGLMLTASQARDLILDVMGQELDQFQQGMQTWLEKQFAQLETTLALLRQVPAKWTVDDAWRSPKRKS